MRIHAIRTGLLGIKSRYIEAYGRVRLVRLASVLLDTRFVQPIPVYTWAIEHPEGVIVIDTGMNAKMAQPGFFPLWQRPYWQTQYHFYIRHEDEIGPQLLRLGIHPQNVRWLVMTHAHFDHTGGLHHFPNAEVLFSRREYNDVQRFRSLHFDFPAYWPESVRLRLIDYVGRPVGPFEASFPLTDAGDVRLVPTPGHTMGHQSVILEHEGLVFFFAGDASFDQPSLFNGALDAPSFNSNVVFQTRRKILEYARQQPMVYLTTHDHATPRRLNERIIVPLQPVRVM